MLLTARDDRGSASLWLNDGAGHFSSAGAVADRVVAPCFGDIDNDGDVDLWLGRAGPDLLLLNDGQGRFEAAAAAGVAGPDALTPVTRLADLDSDGDLDCLSCRWARGRVPAAADAAPAPSSVFSNNADGSFVDTAEEIGLALPRTAVAAVVHDDLDNDRDLDLVIFPCSGPPIVCVNHRLGKYQMLDATTTHLTLPGAVSATSGDPDKDGDRDWLVFSPAGPQLLVNLGGFQFAAQAEFAAACGRLGGTGGQFVDIDNDGDLDIVIADATRRDGSRGPALLLNLFPAARFVDVAEVDPGNLLSAVRTGGAASCVAADFTGDGKCDLLLAPSDQAPMLIENATPGGHWIELDLAGRRRGDRTTRSNNSAIGTRIEVKTGALFQQFVVVGSAGPVAARPLRIHAGLADHAKVDWLRIVWPDAVLQAEMELAADRVVAVEEVSRKTSSCPHLFAWDGARFAFVADFGGGGGLGYYVGPGTYARPDPTEYVPIPALQPRDGQYVLQVVTPLEETTYFDEAKLIAVDHPQGTIVYPNELMAVGLPPPKYEVFCLRRLVDPVRAEDHHGQDVTDRVVRVDRRYAGATAPDRRFAGFAEDHYVELDFGDRLAGLDADARWILCLYGWVEYAYSSTNYAASQAGRRARAPTVEVFRAGRWVDVAREAGYPAGLNHMMTLDVTGKVLPTDRRIRVSSNMEVYWDRIFIAEHDAAAAVFQQVVSPRSADLHFRGYPRAYSPDGRRPNLLDYENVDQTAAWKLMTGAYTRFGDVLPLLQAADDCFVIMGHGEEITLRFAATDFGPVPAGYRRSFLLQTDSYCKDMDLYTALPDTVEPLPFHGMPSYPYGPEEHYPATAETSAYRATYNTRRISGR